MAGDRHVGGEGEIRLIDVAGQDMRLHRRQRRFIFGPADQRPRRARPRRRRDRAGRPRHRPRSARVEQAEPEQGRRVRPPGAGAAARAWPPAHSRPHRRGSRPHRRPRSRSRQSRTSSGSRVSTISRGLGEQSRAWPPGRASSSRTKGPLTPCHDARFGPIGARAGERPWSAASSTCSRSGSARPARTRWDR